MPKPTKQPASSNWEKKRSFVQIVKKSKFGLEISPASFSQVLSTDQKDPQNIGT